MFKALNKYKEAGRFTFKATDRLSQVCNAPREKASGIYLVYADVVNMKQLIYIGISGRVGPDRRIVHRKDGLGGRITNGKQFGEGRRKSWPKKMRQEGIDTLIVKWFVTYGKSNKDFPRPLEKEFLKKLLTRNGALPIWNNEK